mgnify:CR=1 FL=1
MQTLLIFIRYQFNVAKFKLGKINLESMHPAASPTNMHAEWPQGFALPCADESAIFAICSCFAIIAACSALFR